MTILLRPRIRPAVQLSQKNLPQLSVNYIISTLNFHDVVPRFFFEYNHEALENTLAHIEEKI